MFFLKQLGSLLNAVKEIDPDANPSVMIKFKLPNGSEAKAVYVHNSFDGEGDSQGSIVLYNGDDKTEFDSLQYTVDGIQGLCSSTDTNTAAPNSFDTMSADELAGDLVTYMYDKYKGASYIGEKEMNNGAIALRFEWGSDFKDIAQDLTARYGDRITFIRTRSQYAPEQTASGVLVAPPKATQSVTESIDTDKFALVENFPIMKEYGLEAAAPVTESANGSDSAMYTIEPSDDEDGPNDLYIELPASKGWTLDDAETFAEILKDSAPNSADVFYMGSYAEDGTFFQIYIDQKEVRPMTSEEWAQPIKEAIDEIYGDNNESSDVERSVGNSIDTAMMDHYDMMNGDIGDVFESSVKNLCGKAGKPALAEAVIKLFNVYKPVMEAGEDKPHVVPEEIAKAVNDAQAADYGWRPETAEREFNETWDWLEDHADTVLDAWNANNDPREVVRAIEDEEERLVCQYDGI